MRDTEEQAPAATKAAAEDVADSYRQRMSARANVVAIHERRHAQLAWWRFAIFASGVALMIWLGRPGLPWLLVPGLAFVVAAIVHAFVLNARDRAARAVTFYERGLRRLNDEWIGTGETGDRFRSDHHPYADDLDIFGRGSLFELLSTPRTAAGEATLAGWLLAPSRPDVVRDRQQAVQELQPKLDLREGLFVFGPEVRAIVDTDALRAWAQATPRLVAAWPRYVLPLLAATSTLLMLVWIWSGEPPPWLGAALVVQGLVGWWFRAGVREVSEQVERRAQELGVLRDLLALIENEPATTPRLKQLAAELTATGSVPSVEIGRLGRLADLLDSRQNQFFVPDRGAAVARHADGSGDRSLAGPLWLTRAALAGDRRRVRSPGGIGGFRRRASGGSLSNHRRWPPALRRRRPRASIDSHRPGRAQQRAPRR